MRLFRQDFCPATEVVGPSYEVIDLGDGFARDGVYSVFGRAMFLYGFDLTCGVVIIDISPTVLPDGFVDVEYYQMLSASGGVDPYTYSIVAGSLPAGLALSSAGVISGTPTTIGTASFTVRASDSHISYGDRAYSITVDPAIGGSGASYLPAA